MPTPEMRYHRVQCYICSTWSPWFNTSAESVTAQHWHVFERHFLVWVDKVKSVEPPDDPKPTPAITTPATPELN